MDLCRFQSSLHNCGLASRRRQKKRRGGFDGGTRNTSKRCFLRSLRSSPSVTISGAPASWCATRSFSSRMPTGCSIFHYCRDVRAEMNDHTALQILGGNCRRAGRGRSRDQIEMLAQLASGLTTERAGPGGVTRTRRSLRNRHQDSFPVRYLTLVTIRRCRKDTADRIAR